MKLFSLVTIISSVLLLGAWSNPVSQVQSYKYYLDRGNKHIGEKMKKLDLVIIEPIEMQQKYIKAAQKNGTLVYGYINAMEGDKWNKKLYKQFTEDDFYHDKHGKRMYFKEWDSYMMDMTSKHYQKVLMNEINKQVVVNHLDGVFLDTVGNIDSFLPKKERTAQNQALQTFMKNIKGNYDGLSIGQNWGFNTLQGYTAPYVDFIMWEDFSYQVVDKDPWALDQMKKLKKVRAEHGTEVFTIAFTDKKKSKQLAKSHKFKFLYNSAGSYYNEW